MLASLRYNSGVSRLTHLLLSLAILLCLGTVTSGVHIAAMLLKETAVAEDATVTLIATGDTMSSRMVGRRLRTVPDQPLYPFEKILPTLQSADVAFTNLETSIIEGDNTDPRTFQFRSDTDIGRRMREANIRLVSIANNHVHDYGDKGVRRTVEVLRNEGLTFTGAGTENEAYAPAYLEVKGIRIALLAYVDPAIAPPGVRAKGDNPGLAVMNVEKLKAAIAEATVNEADIIIVSMHSGTEYTQKLTNNQQVFAHAAIDAGADIVLGHHPHVPQGTEIYNGKHILYSLGNFAFDQTWSKATMQSVIAKIVLTEDGVKSVELVPIVIDKDYQPRLANS